jgi:hypothetical protein
MDEAGWLACAEPGALLRFLRGKVSPRKLRLFAVACCERILPLMADGWSRAAVDLAERRADGRATEREVRAARAAARSADAEARSAYLASRRPDEPPYGYGPAYAASYAAAAAAEVLSADANLPACLAAYALAGRICDAGSKEAADEAFQAATRAALAEGAVILRDIVGNPFRVPPPIEPRWLTPQVVGLAEGIHAGGDFVALAALAGALGEAGCTDASLLGHLRGPGPHVRGCHVLDLILGKQ